MPNDKNKVINISIHWDSLLERSIASFIGGLLAGGMLYALIHIF